MPATAQGRPRGNFFPEIAGLRIYLALWVAIGHGLQLSGYVVPHNAVMRILLRGDDAVCVFMIVSGFVITNLILTEREPYGDYIVRRFFRLFPAYVICCVIGYFLASPWQTLVDSVPWKTNAGWPAYAASVHQLHYEVTHHFWPHFLLHAVMLHGLIPVEWLNRSAMTFLPAAWSISLEWQFYLVAPFVLSALTPRRVLVPVLVASIAYLLFRAGALGHYQVQSSIFGACGYFAVGIFSRLSLPRLRTLGWPALPAAIALMMLCLFFFWDPLPLVVWCGFFSFLTWRRQGDSLGRLFQAMMTAAPIVLMGEASYSLYLIHRPMEVLFAYIAVSARVLTQQQMFLTQLAAIAVSLPLSLVMFFFLEKPCIRWARKLVKRPRLHLQQEATAAPP